MEQSLLFMAGYQFWGCHTCFALKNGYDWLQHIEGRGRQASLTSLVAIVLLYIF